MRGLPSNEKSGPLTDQCGNARVTIVPQNTDIVILQANAK